jgi:VanZ family protein
MTRFRTFLIYWFPLFLYITLIFSLSSKSTVPGAASFNDKFLHVTEYSILAFLLWRSFLHDARDPVPGARVVSVLFAGLLLGALDELYQSTVPGRISSIFDWLADVAGIIGMTTLLYLRYKYRRGKGSTV